MPYFRNTIHLYVTLNMCAYVHIYMCVCKINGALASNVFVLVLLLMDMKHWCLSVCPVWWGCDV